MENTKYLYGAAVQGIQGFIFQTNELKDIVGASELVSNICTDFFAELLYKNKPYNIDCLNNDPNAILHAAGNIKYIFESREECARIVREFPKTVIEKVPGVTISQAVVKLDSGMPFSVGVNLLEEKLRAQRNKPMRNTLLGAIGIKRSRSTGLPAVYSNDLRNPFQDKGSLKKKEADKNAKSNKLCQDAFGEPASNYRFPYNLCDLTDSNKWIAVIHADGNGLGQIVQKIGDNPTLFKTFSRTLDKVTKKAAQHSFDDLNKDKRWGQGDIIPIRPVVLGGDDLTVICRGSLAIEYVRNFILYFEQFSKEELGGLISDYNREHKGKEIFGTGETHLTACAGIAYIKQNYPFYYGYELAESLCSYAKKVTKSTDKVLKENGLPASCIMFHKVHDSFIEDYQDIKRRELLPCPGKSLQFGPYFLNDTAIEGYWSIDKLLDHANYIEANDREKNFIKSAIRNWLTNIHDSYEMANQIINNTRQSVYDKQEYEYTDRIINPVRRGDGLDYFPAFDILTLLSVSQEIKQKK